jgi:replication-associated recombination protein RarA
LLSRAAVYVLKSLNEDELKQLCCVPARNSVAFAGTTRQWA